MRVGYAIQTLTQDSCKAAIFDILNYYILQQNLFVYHLVDLASSLLQQKQRSNTNISSDT